jgi:hypothetical protein
MAMKKQLIMAALTVSLFGLQAMSCQEAVRVSLREGTPPVTRPRRPSPVTTTTTVYVPPTDPTLVRATAVAQCNQISWRVLGYPVGSIIIVSIGSEPPYGFKNGIDFVDSGNVRVPTYWQEHGFNWAVFLQLPDASEILLGSGDVAACPVVAVLG